MIFMIDFTKKKDLIFHEINVRYFFLAAAPKGSMSYAFTHVGNFLLLLLRPSSPPTQIPVLSPKSLDSRIWALGWGFGP